MPIFASVSVAGCVATMTRVRGPMGERERSGKSKRARHVPVSGWLVCCSGGCAKRAWTPCLSRRSYFLAPHHIRESSHIHHNGSIAILTVQTYHSLTQGKRLRFHIRADCLCSLPQLATVIAVASPRCPRKRADPLVRMGLEHSGPGPDSLPPLASCIARGTDLVQSAVCGWEIRRTGQGSLAGGLSRAINIKHEPMPSLSVPQPSCLLLLLQRPSE